MNLKISDLSFEYSSGKQVLDGVNFQAESGKCTFLLGANGAGKTTLFSNILGLLTPTFGKITLDDADLSSLKPREKKVMELRYGLNGEKPHTQLEVADMLDISRSYVSRIEKKAIKKISDYIL